jgi:phenylacetaldehyde dehydrogenase
MLIEGNWRDAASGRTFATEDPATGESLATVPEGTAEDVDRAVVTARRAFDEGPWRSMPLSDRARIIWRIGELIIEHSQELAQLETLDAGMSLAVALAAGVPVAG